MASSTSSSSTRSKALKKAQIKYRQSRKGLLANQRYAQKILLKKENRKEKNITNKRYVKNTKIYEKSLNQQQHIYFCLRFLYFDKTLRH